jgi:anaerobic selenocysteine-containing dehydrogenase
MSLDRREFLWVMGAAGVGLAAQGLPGVFWTTDDIPDIGWTPGLENQLNTSCLICPARCGIRTRIVDGRLVRIFGNPTHPMSLGGVCPRGIAGVQMLYHPERLGSPMVQAGPRGSDEWHQITQDEAIALIVERLQMIRADNKPEAMAVLAGYCAGSMQELWSQFLQAYGSPNYVRDDYADGTDSIMNLAHGIARQPSFDLERANLVLSFGAPLFEAWWSPLQAFTAFADPQVANGRRPRFVQVDTRFSRTAARSQEWVGIRPGTHAVLALGIAYILIRDQLFDTEFVADHVTGFEDYIDQEGRPREGYRSIVSRNYRTEEVSAITGVPVERITSLAKAFAENQPAVAVFGSDVTLTPNGLLAGLAVHSLNVLVGSINRPGGVLFGDDPPLAPLAPLVLDGMSRQGSQRQPVANGGARFSVGIQALEFATSIVEDRTSPVEALLLYYANPLASTSHPEVWSAALEKIPFVVSFSPFLDESTRHADLVLPDLSPYERWQDAPTPASYPYPVWGLAQPLIEPHEGGIHTGDALLEVARGLGGNIAESLPYEDFEALLKARARGLFSAQRGMLYGEEFERQHHRQMEERGWWLAEHDEFDSFWGDLVERGGWMDPHFDETDPARLSRNASGKVDLVPGALRQALDAEERNRRPYIDVTSEYPGEEAGFPFRLIPYRVSTLASGTLSLERWMAEVPGIFPHVYWDPWVEVNPETALSLDFDDGAMVWIVSARGRYRARLKVSSGTAPENVCAPYGMRHPGGELANPLQLLADSTDPLTGLPSWHSTRVRLEKAWDGER